jgi:dihydrofolate reductase
MAKIVFDTSMSLDGFMTGPGQTADEPLGRGGLRLHEWAFGGDETNQQLMADALADQGAVICGRRTYDTSRWGADGPTGPARRPVFVVTHQAPAESPADGVYTFVTDGLESALKQASAVAGDRDVSIMGGADIGRQYIAAGLVDEISIHLVPVLFGAGTRMFDDRTDHVRLEAVDVVPTPAATHLRYRIVRPQSS